MCDSHAYGSYTDGSIVSPTPHSSGHQGVCDKADASSFGLPLETVVYNLAREVDRLSAIVNELQALQQHKLDGFMLMARRVSELEDKLTQKADKRRRVEAPKSSML
jgi:hypothetical protein